MSSEPQEDSAAEGTIVQNQEELCGQSRMMDSSWNPQLQLHVIVLPQHVTKEEDLCSQQRNFGVKEKEQGSPQIKEEQEELGISQDEEQLDLKKEAGTLMEISTFEENENSEADGNNQQIFNGNDSEEGNQHGESSSTTDEETESQNRDQRKIKDRGHVLNADSSQMTESQCDSDGSKNSQFPTLVKKLKESPKNIRLLTLESGETSRIVSNLCLSSKTTCDEILYFCPECGQSFGHWSEFRIHKITHTGEKPFSCTECDTSFSRVSSLKTHMRTHTEESFSSTECGASLSCVSVSKHRITPT